MLHELTIKQCYLMHILEGNKSFEIRYNDRDFQTGDHIRFLPLEDENYDVYKFAKPIPLFAITYIHSGLGMVDDYICMTIKPIKIGDE